jgi:DNA-binding MarR family transcriptional regulator
MDVAERILAGIGARTTPALNQFVEDNGLGDGLDIQFIQVAYGFAPEPIVPEHLIKRTPYANPDAYRTEMEQAAERGWLDVAGEDRYRLTLKGQRAARALFDLGDRVFGQLEALPEADLKRITALLAKVARKAQDLPEPPKKWALSWGAKFDRGPDAPAMVQVRRKLLDLLSYRDDAHITAWLPYGAGGQVWEAFTYVWRGDAGTAADLVEKLPYRHYDEDAYAAALHELVSRGWSVQQGEIYVATEEGNRLRQEAEDATDRYFDAAWTGLSEAQTEELKGLLERLAEALEPPEEGPV